jgi:hypothetical protein
MSINFMFFLSLFLLHALEHVVLEIVTSFKRLRGFVGLPGPGGFSLEAADRIVQTAENHPKEVFGIH